MLVIFLLFFFFQWHSNSFRCGGRRRMKMTRVTSFFFSLERWRSLQSNYLAAMVKVAPIEATLKTPLSHLKSPAYIVKIYQWAGQCQRTHPHPHAPLAVSSAHLSLRVEERASIEEEVRYFKRCIYLYVYVYMYKYNQNETVQRQPMAGLVSRSASRRHQVLWPGVLSSPTSEHSIHLASIRQQFSSFFLNWKFIWFLI